MGDEGVCVALDQVAAEVKPGLVALAGTEGQAEQHPLSLEGDAPGHEHALGRLVVGAQLQVDGVEEQVDEVVRLEPALAPAPVVLSALVAVCFALPLFLGLRELRLARGDEPGASSP